MKRWGSIFEELDNSKGFVSCTFYYVYFLIRRLGVVACFFLLKDRPIIQAITATVLCWIVRDIQKFYHAARFRPFIEKSQNIVNIIIELCISSCYSLSIFYAFDLEESSKEIVQWIIIGFVMLGFATNISLILYNTILFIIQKVKNRNQMKKVHNEPERDETRELSIRKTTNNDISIIHERSFYQSLERKERLKIQEVEYEL